MSLTTAAVLTGALLVPATSVPPADRPTVLAINPQPEPPGKAKIKRIYSGQDDDRRGKTIKQNKTINQKPAKVSPATPY
jgi:hypothetical protein